MHRITPAQKTLNITMVFILLVFVDIPLTVFYSLTGSVYITKMLLYGSELVIILILGYLLLHPLLTRNRQFESPLFIYFYAGYILLMCLFSLMYTDSYQVFRDARKFIAPLPPLVIGIYFAIYYSDHPQKYINWLIKFLTILSIIGLIEWAWWFLSPGSLNVFYSRFFKVGPYYMNIKHSSGITEYGILVSSLRPRGFIIPMLTKRLTGLYLEPFSAGFNAALAVILIAYNRIAGNSLTRKDIGFLLINTLAVILTTSRSAYLLLFVSILIYMLIQKKYLASYAWGLVILVFGVLFYHPIAAALSSLNWAGHGNPVLAFFDYFLSFDNFLGVGIGAMEITGIYTECGYGAIYGQLGLVGIFAVVFFYLNIKRYIHSEKENCFFVISILTAIFLLLLFAAFPFGYKTFGLIYLCLGFIIGSERCYYDPADSYIYIEDNVEFGRY